MDYYSNLVDGLDVVVRHKIEERLITNKVKIIQDDYPMTGQIEGRDYKLEVFRIILADVFNDYIIDTIDGNIIAPYDFEQLECQLPIHKFNDKFIDKVVDKVYLHLYKNLKNKVYFRILLNCIVAFDNEEIKKVQQDKKYIPKISIGFRTRYACFNNEQGVPEFEKSKVYTTLKV